MNKRLIIIVLALLSLGGATLCAQNYQMPEVRISGDKVRVNGKSYYAHVVLEKQTLYSIGKAYDVSLQDIYDSNRNLDLENAGLKVGQVIFIPTKPNAPFSSSDNTASSSESTTKTAEGRTPSSAENATKTAEGRTPSSAENATEGVRPSAGTTTGNNRYSVIVPPPAESAEPKAESRPEAGQEKTESKQESALDRWLYPGKYRKSQEQPEQAVQPVQTASENSETEERPDDDSPATVKDTVSAFELDIPDRVSVAVILPFTSSRMSDNSVDYYSGLLLAARDLGKAGISVDINAIDVRDSASISKESLSRHDVIIGPITSKDMQSILDKCPEDKLIISPLDPHAAVLAADKPEVQAPTPTNLQNKDIVRWALEEKGPADSLVLITSKGAPLSEGSKCIIEALKESGVRYHTISYGILEGLSIQRSFEAHYSADGVTRYIIAADDESFVNDAVRNINLMVFKKHEVALYAPSRIRSFSMIETEYLHSVNTHISAAYITDFNNKNVSNFIMAYRALFNTEPNQFAFHGYDTLHFFVNLTRSYGRQWPKVLENYSERGLQTDFRFVREEGAAGYVNTAVRRVVYTPDYQIVLQ